MQSSRLVRVDAPLRVVRDGRLVSVPLTHFDDVLSTQATEGRELVAKLIGRTLGHLTHDVVPPGQAVSDTALCGRVPAFGDAGVLELKGPGPGLQGHEVRRAAIEARSVVSPLA